MRVSTPIMPIQYYTVSSGWGNKARKRNGMDVIGEEEIKLFLLVDNIIVYIKKKKQTHRGTWMAQPVGCPTLDFCSVMTLKLCVGCGDCLRLSLSLSLCPQPTCMLLLSLALSLTKQTHT